MIIREAPTAELVEARERLIDQLGTGLNKQVRKTLEIKVKAIDLTLAERKEEKIMGLDQYLYAEAYLPRWEHSSAEQRGAADTVLGAAGLAGFQQENAGVYVRATAAYWRKANQIHAWFVEHVQSGVDNGGTYYVDKSQLAELHETCVIVLSSSELVADMVRVGKTIGPETGGQWKDIFEVGEVILDPKVAQELLPTRSGFFFGSTDYDEWYVQDLVSTVEQLEPLLAYEGQPYLDFHYYASW